MDASALTFAKMHGCGNDYVVVDATRRPVPVADELARVITDRRHGVGGDGLLVAEPSDRADLRMRMFNPDGSEAEMCGNGLRCFALFARERGLAPEAERMVVETGAGLLPVRFLESEQAGDYVTVDMGVPRLQRADIPMQGPAGRVVDEDLEVNGRTVQVTAVSMGNPHVVLFVEDVESAPVETLGPRIETHPAFPRRTNVAFVQVIARDEVRQRTWERGAGETLACGTGACAAVVAGALTSCTGRTVTVRLRGGDLKVRWDEDDHVHLSGPAVEVFEGRWPAAG